MCLSPLLATFIIIVIFFRSRPVAYGSSQATGSNRSGSCQPMPQPQQCQNRATSATYTIAHGNSGSLTHWATQGSNLQPHGSSLGSLTAEPGWELHKMLIAEKWSRILFGLFCLVTWYSAVMMNRCVYFKHFLPHCPQRAEGHNKECDVAPDRVIQVEIVAIPNNCCIILGGWSNLFVLVSSSVKQS